VTVTIKRNGSLRELRVITQKDTMMLQCFGRAIEIEPKNPNLWAIKGKALSARGHHYEAIDCFDKVLKICPNFWNAIDASELLERFNEVGGF
jgi:tetratricopeptide (TPR) repeat protein